jgi:peptide-methionine (R)-S-oxide reductase
MSEFFLNKRMKLAEFTKKDNSLGMERVEGLCGRYNSPHDHLFDDGPAPTGKRHLINSIALDFIHDTSSMKN